MGHKISHIVADWVGDDLTGRTDLHDAPTFHQGDAIAELKRLVQIMADENDRAFQLGLQV